MNYGRLALAAVAAFLVDGLYGFLVYGNALGNQFAQYPGVYRPASDTSHMPVLFAGLFVGALAATFIYAKGYEGGSGVAEGLRFGAALGLFMIGYSVLVSWAVLNIGARLACLLAAAAFGEFLIIGLVIGLVYKPSAAAGCRPVVV